MSTADPRRWARLAAVSFLTATALLATARPALGEPIAGAAVWGGRHGALDQGMAYPLAEWKSLLGGASRGELVAFAGKDSGGMALAHEFAGVTQGPTRVRIALGLGMAVPWEGQAGLSGGKVVVLGVISIGSATP